MEAAFSDHLDLTVAGHITQHFPCCLIDNARTDRNLNRNIFASLTGTVAALTTGTTFSTARFHKAEIDQCVEVFITHQINIAAITAVATIWATAWNIFFATETDTTITTVTCHDQYCGFIDRKSVV